MINNQKMQKNHVGIIDIPLEQNSLLKQIVDKVNHHEEVKTLWDVINVNAVKRLNMTDHGPSHFQVVATNAITILRLLKKRRIAFSICANFGLSNDHAEVVVLLASLLHDLGMSIHRVGHEEFSLFLANQLMREMLTFLPQYEKTVVISEVLHAVISHRSDGIPFTIEAGIVRVADALDMAKGRSRIPYEESRIDIHSVSAMAINDVEIKSGRKKPVQIDITMNHTAGLFQVDELLKKKVIGSGIERYLEIKVYIDKGKGKQLFKDFYGR